MKMKTDQELLQKLLIEDFESRKFKNPAYSMRAYSKKIGINHSALSEIINGKRFAGHKVSERICNALSISPDIRAKLSKPDKKRTADQRAREVLQLKADQYKIVSDWYHFAILSIAETKDFRGEPAWIAKRLGISQTTATDAIARLERLNMISRSKSGKITVTGQSFDSPDGVPNSAIRNTHHQYLDLAHRSLESDSIETRYFNGITMAIDPAKLPEAEKRIRQFRDDLCQFLESGLKKEVYQFCLQLFSLSKEV